MNLFPPIEVARHFKLDEQKVYRWSKMSEDHHYRKTYVIYEKLMAREKSELVMKMTEGAKQ
ncbi:MAG: hypothetical protein WC464_00175 [Bdellovibrionales bacterium]|jgi:hypothetical protein